LAYFSAFRFQYADDLTLALERSYDGGYEGAAVVCFLADLDLLLQL